MNNFHNKHFVNYKLSYKTFTNLSLDKLFYFDKNINTNKNERTNFKADEYQINFCILQILYIIFVFYIYILFQNY